MFLDCAIHVAIARVDEHAHLEAEPFERGLESSRRTLLCGFLRTPNLIAIALIANQQRDARFRPANATATEQSTKQLPRLAACAALPPEYAQCRLLADSGKATFAASSNAFHSLVVCVFSQLANDRLH
jgi:hypothetical protein